MDIKIELIFVPVSDLERSREFYLKAGFVLDQDQEVSPEVHFIQMTPPGSACSIAFGRGISPMKPGELKAIQAVVADAAAARADLAERGIEVSDVDEQPWGSFVHFEDPDGNTWALQQLPQWSVSAGGDGVNPNT